MVKSSAQKTARPTVDCDEDSTYWADARQPLCCLVFLLPLATAYEMGALMLRPESWPEQRLVAQRFIQQLAAWLGADAFWIPGAALIATLFIWQFISRASWRLRGWAPLIMIFESFALAIPLIVLGKLLQQSTAPCGEDSLKVQIVLALGAGVYEELVFRFYIITGLIALFVNGFRIPKNAATIASVATATLLFALCHFAPVGSERLDWPLFMMFAAAGAYLSIIFVLRGLGVATGCHVVFNLITLLTTAR